MAAKMRDTVHDALMKQPEGGEELQLPGGATSLDLLQAVYRDAAQPLHRRLLAARAALPFEHPKLAVAVNVSGHDLANRMKALAIRKRGYDPYVIDAKPQREEEIEKAPE